MKVLTSAKPAASHMAFRSLIGSLPVPPTFTARRNATKVFNSGLAATRALKDASATGSPRRGRLFGWFSENPATAFAQTGMLLAHAGGNTFHTRNFRCTKPKNVTGAETALIVLRKRVTRCRQHCQTKSQTRCNPQIANGEQIKCHTVSPELTDVAVATRRLAVLESSVMVSIRASTLQDSQPQVHRNFAPTTQIAVA
jgi:hypothetical protein